MISGATGKLSDRRERYDKIEAPFDRASQDRSPTTSGWEICSR